MPQFYTHIIKNNMCLWQLPVLLLECGVEDKSKRKNRYWTQERKKREKRRTEPEREDLRLERRAVEGRMCLFWKMGWVEILNYFHAVDLLQPFE